MSATTRGRRTCERKITSPMPPASLEPTRWTPGMDPFLAGFVQAFPDLQLTVEDAVAEGDLVAQRVHFEGTHTGEFQGLPPTHRKVTFSGLELNRFVDGRVAEHWFQMDPLTLLQQLGLVVVPARGRCRALLAHQIRSCARNAEHLAVVPATPLRNSRKAHTHSP